MGHPPMGSDWTHHWSLGVHSGGPVHCGSSGETLNWLPSRVVHEEEIPCLKKGVTVVGLTRDDLEFKQDSEL